MPSTTSTTMLCQKCGGAISPPRDFHGRTCTCATLSSGSDPAMTAVGHKYCSVCGTDVTHARRMKDHTGRYWCYDCGAAEQMKKGSAIAITCHDCHRSLPPTLVLKHRNDYVCQECLEKRTGRRKHKKTGPAQLSQASGFALGLGLVMVAAGTLLIVLYFMDWL